MNARPIRQARMQNRPGNQDPPVAENPAAGIAPQAGQDPVQVVVGQEAVEELARDLGGQAEAEPVRDQRGEPRRQRRRVNVDLSDLSSTSSEEEAAELPRRRPRPPQPRPQAPVPADDPAEDPAEDEDDDELVRAVKAKKMLKGKWSKSHVGITPGEQVILAETRQLFASFPESLASIIRLGGNRPLGDFLIQIQSMITKFKAMKDALKFKIQVPKSTTLLIDSSLEVLVDFRDRFGPLSYNPSALSSLISFYSEGVFGALYGKEAAAEAASQLRAFGKVNRTLSSVSFSSLMKWTNRNGQRQQNQSKKSQSNSRYSDREERGNSRDRSRSLRKNRM